MRNNRSTEVILADPDASWPITLKVDDGDIRTIRITPEEAAVLGRELIEAAYDEVIIGIKLEVKQ